VVKGPDLTINGGSDAFVAKVSLLGNELEYCGYIGGADADRGQCIAVDAEGNAYIGGYPYSTQNSFPVLNGPDSTFNGYFDGFIAKVNSEGTGLDFCGYIGGVDRDGCDGIAVDNKNNVYVTGSTYSDERSSAAAPI